jgi:hypothetical protein
MQPTWHRRWALPQSLQVLKLRLLNAACPRAKDLDQVPVPPEAMFDEQRMAGGGIVAFQPGGASA